MTTAAPGEERVCACGAVAQAGDTKCAKCRRREASNNAIDESLRRLYPAEHTPLMFGEEKK